MIFLTLVQPGAHPEFAVQRESRHLGRRVYSLSDGCTSTTVCKLQRTDSGDKGNLLTWESFLQTLTSALTTHGDFGWTCRELGASNWQSSREEGTECPDKVYSCDILLHLVLNYLHSRKKNSMDENFHTSINQNFSRHLLMSARKHGTLLQVTKGACMLIYWQPCCFEQ